MTQNRAALEILAGVIPDWVTDAVCRTADPGLFFPEGYGKEPAEKTARAIAMCNQCPCKQACFDYSMSTSQRWGVWGGVDERTRGHLLVSQRYARSHSQDQAS